MSEIRVNGVTLYYEEHGAGPPILCIHGAGSSALLWGDAVGDLAERGRAIVYDRRGCTRSERPVPYEQTTAREHAEDAAALLRALDATPAIVIGRSFGGEIALLLAQHYPELVRGLALLEPAVSALSPEFAVWIGTLAAQLRATAEESGPAAAADQFLRAVLGEESASALPDAIRQVFVDNYPAIAAELSGAPYVPDAGALASLVVPVLVVSGASSPPEFRALDEKLVGMLPRARHEITGGGHLVNPAAPAVLSFLDEQIDSQG